MLLPEGARLLANCAESPFYLVRWLQDIVLIEESSDIIKAGMRKIFHHQIGACLL